VIEFDGGGILEIKKDIERGGWLRGQGFVYHK